MEKRLPGPCEQSLRAGTARLHAAGDVVRYRFLAPSDDAGVITELLHAAYAPLAAAGMRFVASYQDVDVTRRRMAKGDTIVALVDGRLIGVVTLASPSATTGSAFYERPEVASFGQFAVEPGLQHRGIGATLLALVEELAAERGVRELALDTSERAERLIRFYTAKGYRFVEFCQWPQTNYRSMIFAKRLSATGARERP